MYEVIETKSYELVMKFKGKKRNTPVTIVIEKVAWENSRVPVFERPISIVGVIEVTETKGRPQAPDPLSQFSVSSSSKSHNFMKGTVRNSGRPDMHKGHIMALELGGPDHAFNIVPQWANFQSNGAWRKFETDTMKRAAASQSDLTFSASVIYGVGSFARESTPVGIYVEIHDGNTLVASFDKEQMQDNTDEMMFLRQMDRIDSNSGALAGYRKNKKGKLERKPSGDLSSDEEEALAIHEKPQKLKTIKKRKAPPAILQGGMFKIKLNKKAQDKRVKEGLLKLKNYNKNKQAVEQDESDSETDLSYEAMSISDESSSDSDSV